VTTHRTKVSAVLMLFFIPRLVGAQLMYAWSYEEMFDKADLVVIARPLSTKETNEHKTWSGDLHFIGANTEFEKRLVLKGTKDVKRFVLHYYKLVETNVAIINGPAPLTFDLKEPHAYLMFLIDKGNGTFAPATDEMDPGTFSIIKLDSAAE
jgi:hypothetical protein